MEPTNGARVIIESVNESEHLSAFPEGTKLYDSLHWSQWGASSLAMVVHDATRFQPATLERRYIVRFAIELHLRNAAQVKPMEFNSSQLVKFVGSGIAVHDPRAKYEETEWMLGSSWYGSLIRGTFSKPVEVYVKTSIKALDSEERRQFKEWLHGEGYTRIDSKMGKRQVERLLRKSFKELQQGHYKDANAADDLLSATGFDTTSPMHLCEAAWRTLGERGVYAETRDGGIKYLVKLPPQRDLCPLCGEDRAHPSQRGKHRC